MSTPNYAKSKFVSREPLVRHPPHHTSHIAHRTRRAPSLTQPNQDPKQAKWIRLTKTTYLDPNGTERTWEAGERQTRPANCAIDGVNIVTILNKPGADGPELLLQKQYRPPIDKVAIEVPAGLIDEGESVEVCAVRELKEETGFVGVAEQTSAIMFNGLLSLLLLLLLLLLT